MYISKKCKSVHFFFYFSHLETKLKGCGKSKGTLINLNIYRVNEVYVCLCVCAGKEGEGTDIY